MATAPSKKTKKQLPRVWGLKWYTRFKKNWFYYHEYVNSYLCTQPSVHTNHVESPVDLQHLKMQDQSGEDTWMATFCFRVWSIGVTTALEISSVSLSLFFFFCVTYTGNFLLEIADYRKIFLKQILVANYII